MTSNLNVSNLSYRPSPVVGYYSPEKSSTYLSSHLSRSGISGNGLSESRSLGNYYELKNTMEHRYIQDLDHWRSQAQDAEHRRDLLEKENARLIQELSFWRNKKLISAVKKGLSSGVAKLLSTSEGSHQELLTIEINSLRNQLHEKLKEVDEQRKIYFDQELRTVGARAVSDQQLKSYEAQLNVILRDIQEKIDQAAQLQKENASLLSHTSNLSSVQREVKDIRSLLEYNYEESQKLKAELTNQQVENYKLRRSELTLKEQEQHLLTQVEIIQNKISQTNQLRESEQTTADRVHNTLLDQLKADHQNVQESLNLKRLSYSQLISQKEKNVEDLRRNLEEVKDKIGRSRIRGSSSKREAEEWRTRKQALESERELTVSRLNSERERSVEAIRRVHNNDVVVLETQVNRLRGDLHSKDEQILQRSVDLSRSRIEKEQVKLSNRSLQTAIEIKRRTEEDAERQRQAELLSKDRIHEREQDILRTSAKFERSHLQSQERVLGQVLDSKSREALDARSRANTYLLQASEAERRSRQKSIESEAQRINYTRTEIEKSAEVEAARNLRRSQVEALRRSHEVDIAVVNRNQAVLHSALAGKNNEVRSLQATNNLLANDLLSTHNDVRRASVEASVWRTRAEVEERDKQTAILSREFAHANQLETIRRQQDLTRSNLQGEIAHISAHINLKNTENHNWRNSYNRLYNNSFHN